MGLAIAKSLYMKQAIATMLLAMILSLSLSLIQAITSLNQEQRRIDDEFSRLLTLVEQPLAQALFRVDRVFAQQQADSLLFHPAIDSVEIKDEYGDTFAISSSATSVKGVPDYLVDVMLPEAIILTRTLDLKSPAIHLGDIKVTLDRQYLVQQIVSFNIGLLGQNLVKDMLLASLISLLFYFLVTRPLQQLTGSLARMSQNVHQPLPPSFYRSHRRDELGRLRQTFEELWGKLSTALNALERSHQHSKAIIDNAADAIIVVDDKLHISLVNSAAEKLTGLSLAQLRQTPLSELHRDDMWLALDELIIDMPVDTTLTVESLFKGPQQDVSVEIRIAKYMSSDKTETILLIRDLSERKEAEERINRLSFYDSLTRLPNRRLLTERLQKQIGSMQEGEAGALILLDLDRFKTINDSLGHNVGDQLLAQITEQLIPIVPDKVTFARMGGDEFVFLWPKVDGDLSEVNTQLVHFVQSVLARCANVKYVAGHELHVTASIGISYFSSAMHSPSAVLRQADTALYKAKETGRNTFAFYHADMQARSDARLKLEHALHKALANNEFEVFYQPQNDEQGGLIGAEALLRWRNSELGFVSPATFIPVAEEIGLIIDIGRWVLQDVIHQVSQWTEQDIWQPHWRMSINVSPLQFQHPGLVSDIQAFLQQYDVPASLIDLEITENMLLADLETCLDKMHALRDIGVSLSIDDFGTGYSSLKYLKSLPIDRLKIDQSFVRDLLTDSSDEAIVLAVIAMAKALELNVLAEGVETEEHYQHLAHIGCLSYQGYYFGRPCSASEFQSNFIFQGYANPV